MNTPPKLKRYKKPPEADWGKDALFIGHIDDPEILKHLAAVMTGFVHLELRMASVLAVLLGSSDKIAAGYVLNAIKSPSGRVDVMKELLEKAPINQNLGPEYDQIIQDFKKLSLTRNRYVHGRWWTDARSKETVLDETDAPHATLQERCVVTVAELQRVTEQIATLHRAIYEGPEAVLRKLQQASPQSASSPNPAKHLRRRSKK